MAETRQLSEPATDLATTLERVLESASGYQTPEGTVRWPEDSFPHPSYRAESWQLMAYLEDKDGGRYSVLQQLDRIAVHSADALSLEEQNSGWQFRDVMRGALHVMSDSQPRRDWQSVQRVALGLSGAEPDSSQASAADIHVGPNRLRVEVSTSAETDQPVHEQCPMQFQTTMSTVLQLKFTQLNCGENAGSGPLRVVTSSSVPVEGGFDDGRQLQGTGWVRQAFGELPAAGSPIIFDTALVEINDVGLLEISRSKRRSGRGPETLTASVRGKAEHRFDDLVWVGVGADQNTETPVGWRVHSVANQLDVALEPVSADAWVTGPGGTAWRGAVSVSGSHSGVGFIEIQPVSTGTVNE